MKALRNALSLMVVVTMLASGVVLPAQAAMIQTQEIAARQTAELDKARISQFLAQGEIRDHLLRQGVSPDELTARLNALSPAEAADLAQRIDALPAGGSSILGVALFIFLVLLFTDIMGFTQIFPFVVSTANK